MGRLRHWTLFPLPRIDPGYRFCRRDCSPQTDNDHRTDDGDQTDSDGPDDDDDDYINKSTDRRQRP